MKQNLYEELGVPKTASKEDIRKAYRKKSKKAHPDMKGGSSEKFALVKKAHDILTDDERRAKYDSSGDETESQPNNEIAESISVLTNIMGSIFNQIDSKNGDPSNFDVVSDMKTALKMEIEKIEEKISSLKSQVKKTEKLLGRFKVKSGENFLENVIRVGISNLNMQIAQGEKALAINKKAMDVLKGYSWDWTPGTPYDQNYYGRGSSFQIADFLHRAGY